MNNDTAELNKVLHDPETPFTVKKQLTDLRDKYETRKGVQARELRSRQSLVQKSYKQAIDAQRKTLDLASSKEKPAIQKEIKRLEALQAHDLKKLTKDPDSYTRLALWNNVDPDYFPEESEGEQEGFEMEGGGRAKVKFDKSNPQHVARLQQVYQATGGDKARTNQILAEEFEL